MSRSSRKKRTPVPASPALYVQPVKRHSSTARVAAVLFAALSLVVLISCGKSCSKTTKAPSTRIENERPVAVPVVASAQTPYIRVAVEKDVQQVRIASGDSGASILGANGTELRRIPARTPIVAVANAGGISIDGTLNIPENVISIRAVNGRDTLALEGQDVAPEVILYRPGNAVKMHAIARLNLEDYLGGVLAGEVPYKSWHPEAMKTQAITSRTFALYQLQRSTKAPYDVESTIMSQVFKPGAKDHPAIASAVNGTSGLVLTNDGAVFCAYFHSTCGSHTEPAPPVFPDAPNIAPLRGTQCNHCAQSPAYRWRATFSKSALEAKLKVNNPALGTISRLEFLNTAGQPLRALERASIVKVHHSGGVLTLQGNAFRLAANPKELKSLSFETITERGDAIEISGAGFGHGVGLCQWGSQGLAQTGYGYAQILGKYFPGAELTKAY